MVQRKRKLQDLYKVGCSVQLDDGSGDPVEVWLQKLSAVEAEECARRAGAARSRVLMAARHEDSEEWLDTYNDLSSFSREQLVDIVLADESAQIMQRVQAELASEDEWSKDDYLQGLTDSWFGELGGDGGLKFIYESGDEDHDEYFEAKKIFVELQRYDQIVAKKTQAEIKAKEKDFLNWDISVLRHDAVERQLRHRGDQAWITEWRRSMMLCGVREVDNHKRPYFANMTEVRELAPITLELLIKHFNDLNVELTQGKDLLPIQDSSPPQEQLDEAETADSSGQLVAAQ